MLARTALRALRAAAPAAARSGVNMASVRPGQLHPARRTSRALLLQICFSVHAPHIGHQARPPANVISEGG